MKTVIVLSLGVIAAGCVAPQQYWVRPATSLQLTAADLQDCRQMVLGSTYRGAERVYTPLELESPCMVAKGYGLSNRPPAP